MFSCTNRVPSERIRVFISSAQSNENGFAWADIRRRIKDALSQCIYLNPFIIEDNGAVTPSVQFFQRQVERADVIVLLVKGEIRPGTGAEYALASKLNKPLLVYFLEDDSPSLDVIKLKKDIQTSDRCTYHRVSDFNSIEDIVWNDLMNEIVRAFQDKYYVYPFDEDVYVNATIPEESTLLSAGIPSKTALGKFCSCYNYFFDTLKLDFYKKDIAESELHKFGCALILWLMSGEWKMGDAELSNFVSGCSNIFSTVDWLEKRWDAIRFYNMGELSKALASEERALELAKKANESNWIISDILIDCRNLECEINKENRIISFNGKYQVELSKQEYMVCLPVLDRYLTNIYDKIEKEEFRVETASPSTELFGTNLAYTLTDFANYLFTAAVYGSNTHLHMSRKILAHILSRYSVITKDYSLAFVALQQLILYGEVNNYKLYLDSSWDVLYPFVASQADDLWQISEFVPVAYRDSMKLTVFESLGLYLTDSVFTCAETYIYNYSNNIYWGNSEAFFDAILSNIYRMNPERIVEIITPIIEEKRFSFGNKLSHIILSINLVMVGEELLIKLASALKHQLPNIISRNGEPQMIAALIKRSKSIFGDLEAMDGNGLVGLQEKLYKINLGSENWIPILREEIDSARFQFEENSKEGVFYEFASNPYSMINKIIRDEKSNDEIDKLLINDFIPLAVDILNSDAAVQTKESCVACLCDVISSFIKKDLELPDTLIAAIKEIDIRKGSDFSSSRMRKSLEIRILMVKIISGILGIRSLFQWCIDFRNLETNEKIVVIDCIEKYLYYRRDSLDNIDSILVSIILQCSTESNPDIRKIAYLCVAYIASSENHDIVFNTLNNAVYDPSSKVRYTLLSLCKNGILSESLSSGFIDLLRNDANYNIRTFANSTQ